MTGVEPLAAVRALHIASTIAVAGAFVFRLLVLPGSTQRPRAAEPQVAVVERWLAMWCGAALAVGLASWLAWLVLTASGMSGTPVREALDGEILGAVVGRTTFGRVWAVRLACMLGLAACLVLAHGAEGRGASLGRAMAAGLALLLLLTLAGAGHAVGGAPTERALRVATDALHLLGAGSWLGALVPLLFVLSRASATPGPGWQALAAASTRRFSALGVLSVLLLLGPGIVNAALLVGSWAALGSTTYGRLVAAKVALFGLIVAIAAVNRLVLTPRLGRPAARHQAVSALRRNVIAELGIGASIVAVVGLLGTTPPSAHEHMGGSHTSQGNGGGGELKSATH